MIATPSGAGTWMTPSSDHGSGDAEPCGAPSPPVGITASALPNAHNLRWYGGGEARSTCLAQGRTLKAGGPRECIRSERRLVPGTWAITHAKGAAGSRKIRTGVTRSRGGVAVSPSCWSAAPYFSSPMAFALSESPRQSFAGTPKVGPGCAGSVAEPHRLPFQFAARHHATAFFTMTMFFVVLP